MNLNPFARRNRHNAMTGYEVKPTDTPETILQNSGFDFDLVDESAGYVDGATGKFVPLPGRKILRRSDTGAAISVVGDGYKAHQPKQILNFFLGFAEKLGLGLGLASLGVMEGGRRYWALAKTGVSVALDNNGDRANLFALLASASDGSMTSVTMPSANRPFCDNSWLLLFANARAQGLGTRQSHRSEFSNELAAKGLGFDLDASVNIFEQQAEEIRMLNAMPVGDHMAKTFFRTLLRPEEGNFTPDQFVRAMRATEPEKEVRGFDAIMTAYTSAPGARPGTARGLWEAATYFVDHARGGDGDARLKSALFGQGAKLKQRAWENIQTLANAA